MGLEKFSDDDLVEFQKIQKLAYEAVLHVRKQLFVGITEKEAASMIDSFLRSKGVNHFFHYGFAWFGERTAFVGFQRPGVFSNGLGDFFPPHMGAEFLPSDTKLASGMPVILDVAPIWNGYSADIGYSFAYGENSTVDRAILDLEIFRSQILSMVLAEKTLSEIYLQVSKMISGMGYSNCHSIYPMGVLGHKVGKIPFQFFPFTNIMGFQIQTFLYFFSQFAEKTLNGLFQESSLWNDSSRWKPDVGLWAVEPHIGKNGIGVKWEEILVVTDSTAYWLDDDLPHVNFWKTHSKETHNV
jgi:Xaa-Pro aminopeptidase